MSTLYEPLPKEFVSKTASFDYKTPMTQALDGISRFGAVIVVKDREYFGIADGRAVSRKGSERSLKFTKTLPIGRFARKLPVLGPDVSVGRAISYFHEFSAKAFPYQEGRDITGIVKRDVVLRSIISLHLLSKSVVGDAMSTPVLAIDADASLSQAMSVMSQNKITRLIVVDGGRPFGLITHKDIYSSFARVDTRHPELTPEPRSLSGVNVRSLARTETHSIDYRAPLEDGIRSLLSKGISSLIVTRNGRPVGMLSVRDVFELAASGIEKVRSRVIVTGIDESTADYEQDIENEANRMIDKMDRFGRLGISYAAINVNKVKNRGYELKARLGFERRGVIYATATGYGLEGTLAALLDSLFKQVKERKEMVVSFRKGAERYYGEK
jgi:predicted transcriptional regulator